MERQSDTEIIAQLDGPVLRELLGSGNATDAAGNVVPLGASPVMASSALMLQRLIYERKPRHCLEIGLARGASALAVLYALDKLGLGTHTAIDPYQRTGDNPDVDAAGNWCGVGVEMIRRAGLSGRFTLIEEPDYLVLPEMVRSGRRFDLIFIDGWHSFDYVFLDYFYADLLLNDGGLLLLDDSLYPQIHEVCRFIETHKRYVRLSPSNTDYFMALFSRLRHPEPWGRLCAFRKVQSTVVPNVPQDFLSLHFYRHGRSMAWLMALLRRAQRLEGRRRGGSA